MFEHLKNLLKKVRFYVTNSQLVESKLIKTTQTEPHA